MLFLVAIFHLLQPTVHRHITTTTLLILMMPVGDMLKCSIVVRSFVRSSNEFRYNVCNNSNKSVALERVNSSGFNCQWVLMSNLSSCTKQSTITHPHTAARIHVQIYTYARVPLYIHTPLLYYVIMHVPLSWSFVSEDRWQRHLAESSDHLKEMPI